MSRRLHPSELATVMLFAGVCLAATIQQPAPKPGKARVADPPVIDSRGYQQVLARHRGKPLLVNFWATWCEPCRDEYPMVNELARKYAPQGLVVVGISLDEDAEINLMRRFLARHNPVFSNYRKRPGNEEAFINAVSPQWSGAIPATFFYSPDGGLAGRLVGEHGREEFERAIQALVQSSSKSAGLPGTQVPFASRLAGP